MDDRNSRQLRVNENLHALLMHYNLSAVSRELSISKSLLSDWSNCKRVPSLRNVDALLRLAQYFNVSLEALLVEDLSRSNEIRVVPDSRAA